MTPTLEERFWAKVDKTDACWLWTAAKDPRGYGYFKVGGKLLRAHRVAYEFLVGPIPCGLTIDHLCCVKSCVRPDHLEPVTGAENQRRAAVLRTHCKHGHEFTPENTHLRHGARICVQCQRVYRARYRNARKAVAA